MRGDRARGWPVKTKVALASPAFAKELTIEAADVRKPLTLQLPAGTYQLTIAAEHHRVYKRTLELSEDRSLPEIALSAIPAISGKVVARQRDTEIPLAGAQILAGTKQLTTTNEQGLFHVDLPEDPPPDSITATHTGWAPATVPLFENLVAENELGTIVLPRGVVVTIELDRRDDERKPLTVTLIGKRTNAAEEVKPGQKEVVFPGIPPGDYRVMVKGTQPLESMTEEKTFEVKDDDLDHKVEIAPYRLDGRVIVGNEALRGGGTAEISGPSGTWRAPVQIGDDGRFGGILWQPGKVSASLKTALTSTPIVETSPDLGNDPSQWNIILKRRSIEGHVYDIATKEPVTNARVEVNVTLSDRKTESTLGVQKDGTFTVPAIQNGRYDIRVTSADHADGRRVLNLGKDEETQTAEFPLEGGIEAEVWFAWPNGDPVAGARVLADDGKVMTTDKDGRVVLRLHERETRGVTVLPRQGSFAIAEVSAPRSGSAKMQFIVPPPAGSIRIRSSLPGPVSISYKGRELPSAVFQYLRADSGEPGVMRLVHLPAGEYGIFARGARWVPLRLDSGEQSVELVPFQPRRPPK